MTRYLPIMLDCEGQPCVVIGGGVVAERKVSGLLEAGAAVKVISPSLTDPLDSLAEKGLLIWMDRTYAPGDLRGAFLVYAATNDRAVNEEVARESRRLGIHVNVASHAEAGNFITPGVVRRGRLTVAVSTSGAGPLAATKIKNVLEKALDAAYEPYLDFVHAMRTRIKEKEPSAEVRGRLLRKLGALDVLNEMSKGTFIAWSPEDMDAWIAEQRVE
ncbi:MULTISPECIES: NAD(P)-dependent oxidoreductase [unclassified Paenibacillus]|uniref:precorrin-2 dehydrogenase/sirohydrochlorin ferrochelatase family protein n=1 Tax=unclassified Paenibacillus TaxID=185978 RepID=UPI00247314F8|nr:MULTISPECIES: NAD(P)-dependent oxidoreductase [unclassified Paenibacillus]MDH6431141.1 precorrin-2 dehydrogenase/sirohydrochlorin ferrochelatase [Paenibacillus sp. PastH-4]MDH6447204.1 precorrin-2 dehydrogenase/sirohydrochlorin ferrochelatase [Paenibacillus sp. PastF-4]MDH6531354.1 precorrin-2 dehydrogenase/sirohydrochlorin ferrochelatase [Paenibacillus sp. PastH-3]